MNLVSTVSEKVVEYMDLAVGMVFVKYDDAADFKTNHSDRAWVKINKIRAYDLRDPKLFWVVSPSVKVRRVYVAVD